jgi:hypothetical protein
MSQSWQRHRQSTQLQRKERRRQMMEDLGYDEDEERDWERDIRQRTADTVTMVTRDHELSFHFPSFRQNTNDPAIYTYNYIDHILLLEAHVKGLIAYINQYGLGSQAALEDIERQVANIRLALKDPSDGWNSVENRVDSINKKFDDIVSALPLLKGIENFNSYRGLYELVISNFHQEEHEAYKEQCTEKQQMTDWNIIQTQAINLLFGIPQKQIGYLITVIMKYYTDYLKTNKMTDAITHHMNNYFKTAHDLEDWISTGLDWLLCYGQTFDVPTHMNMNDGSNQVWFDIIQLGKLGCYREECVSIDVHGYEVYIYTYPDYETPNSFSNLVLKDKNPFNALHNLLNPSLYSPPLEDLKSPSINLSHVIDGATYSFGTRDAGLFRTMLQRRPYMFIFISTLLTFNHTFFAVTESIINNEVNKIALQSAGINVDIWPQEMAVIDEFLKLTFPGVYSLLPHCSLVEKWYFRALAQFAKHQQDTKDIIMTIYPWDNIEQKFSLLLGGHLIYLNTNPS